MLILGLAPAAANAAERVCDHSETRATPSPDGQWVANVQEEVCDTGNGAAAGITVVIASVKDQARSKRVFMMPVPRSRDDWPRVRWQGANAVELRVANLSGAPAPEAQYEGIRISLTFCNDNPADRAAVVAYKAAVLAWQKDVTAWAEKRKQNPDAVGARPARPEEPRLSPGRCTE
ncbi:MAG: hypothetical protein ABI645_09270 [Pseudomonadota bacterium]